MIEYIIPVQGLESGHHRFNFDIDKTFFDHFGNSIIEDGSFQVQVDMDRRPDMILCAFTIEGHMVTACDRCLETIRLPISNELELMFKFATETGDEDDMIVFLPQGTAELNLGHYLYEMLCLSAPLVRAYDCENDASAPCNEEVLSRLNNESLPEGDDSDNDNPVWDVLKDWNDN